MNWNGKYFRPVVRKRNRKFQLELVSKPEEEYLSTIRQVFKKRESSHRNRRIEGFLPSFKIVIAPTF
ncbi:hypothetical protein C4Q31_03485 [Leptospira borgpetersenii serovar Ceylonica]|nr:hypothetical protein C4Q31_03485 [Leptospira borgpetersenii serovar Ceylonica]QHE28485.1 hypothetical protein GS524_08760 [Leptospira borgpetersenii]QHE31790.1 hypothetical protein GS523_08775 [Leptospira borgpetersenii]QHE35087.1 hypothetical protein GS517_08765 [Leptospira borgpetersenii]QHE38319.1 hypothetical protein GS510_08415 [Leptospira borgpetersenii]